MTCTLCGGTGSLSVKSVSGDVVTDEGGQRVHPVESVKQLPCPMGCKTPKRRPKPMLGNTRVVERSIEDLPKAKPDDYGEAGDKLDAVKFYTSTEGC